MDKLFLTILNMSLTGAFVISVICLARLPLKKAPKIISYCLWAVAGFRLVFPFSIESVFSLIPFKAQTIPTDIAMQDIPRIDSGIPFINNAVSSVLPTATPTASANPLQIWIAIGAYVWLVGVAVMLVYGVVSFFILKKKMSEAAHIEANIYEAENIKSPFVLGVLKPRIYLPIGLSEQEKSYIILHEQTHIKRHDHIVKFAAYFILCLHWFNPFAWVAFLLMGIDMEMSCDECVLKEIGSETKQDYSLSLLSLATERRIIGGSPLAFGEGGVKERIKNVLNFKKPSRVLIVTAVALVAVLSVGFAVNRMSGHEPLTLGAYTTNDGLTQMVFHGNNEFYIVRRGVSYSPTGVWVYETEPNDNKVILMCADDERYVFSCQANSLTFEWGAWLENWIEPGTVFTLSEEPLRQNILQQYILENADDNDHLTKMTAVTLYHDGTARLATPPISSYMLPNCTYVLADGELLIYASIETEESENAFGVKNGAVIARFIVEDDNALIFNSATVPLFADEGARYVSVPFSTVPLTTYEPQKWVDFFRDEELPWTSTYDLMLNEFPGVMFSWTSATVTVTDSDGIKDLFMGMPIWNVYLADLNGDGLPELCATVSFGSGLIDTRVIVYDYVNDRLYDLSDRGYYDYFLSIENSQLIVTQARFLDNLDNDIHATGSMAIIDGELVTFGIDRTLPEIALREATSPDILSPTEIVRQELLNDGCKINDVFLMSQSERKSLQSADNGELATVYASYTEGEYGDAIYCMRYDFERATTDSPWTHVEPTFWDGIAVDVAAYVARSYYAEQTGSDYGSLVVTWAGQGEVGCSLI